MPRSHDDRREYLRFPKWKQRKAFGNPPQSYRQRYRRLFRVRMQRFLKADPENFQPFPANRVTSIYDWY